MISKKLLLTVLKFLLFLGLGLGILYLVYRNQNAAFQEECALKGIPSEDCSLLGKVWNDFRTVNYFWILMVFVVYALSNVSRAIRWNMLLRSLGYQPRFINALLTTIVGYFANLGLPRMGEVVRAGLMARYEKIAIEKVMGTVVVDRIVDVLSILVVTTLAIWLDFNNIQAFANEHIRLGERFGGGQLLYYAAAAAGLALVVLWLFRQRLLRLAIVQKILHIARGFAEGIQTIRRLERPWLFVLHSINIWVMFFLMSYFCFLAFAPTASLPLLAALTVFVFGAWGVVIPSPGGMGTYHFMVQLALGFYGISGDDGFSFANISFFAVQLGCNILWGILALLLLPGINGLRRGVVKTELG
ncbi:MAG TPA: lysylphosphatidylglycerol synthase transmembrane domain-containing protein [Saprospiraceae bacterium]|nr:lysylphosphatidylglycerol synthase transmembrane domain-containing protein [Saprospiraceae bacterium]HMP23767.1 lysylphosphatidylglycerol synthase transmembrane domain-containing protein [Saprospiraceae bacterium]